MKNMISTFLILSLIFNGTPVFAGKSYSSGGGSRSVPSSPSRSSSMGRSSSLGGSTRPSIPSSRPSSSGKSYSTGSSSKPYSPPVTHSAPSGKSYSTGSTPAKPAYTPSYTPPAKSPVAQTPSPAVKTPSGKSYSTGSSTPAKPAYTPSYTPPVAASPSGKTYSTGSPTTPPPNKNGNTSSGQPPPVATPPVNPQAVANSGPSTKPKSTSFNSDLSKSAKKEESQVKYNAANPVSPPVGPAPGAAPRSTYKSPTGQTQKINANAPQVQTVRNYVTHERYVTYDHRVSGFYGGYYGHPYYYNDYYSPFLFGWIMSDALNSHQRALWMYHHQNDMDQARYQAMLAKDAQLEAEIAALRAQNVARNPSYVPPQMQDNPDVMYNKEFVDASYNPTPAAPVMQSGGISGWTIFWTIFWISVICIGIYYVFIKEFK